MSTKKISQLNQLSAGYVDTDNDYLAIVDTSASETKKILPNSLFAGSDGSPGTLSIGQHNVPVGKFNGGTVALSGKGCLINSYIKDGTVAGVADGTHFAGYLSDGIISLTGKGSSIHGSCKSSNGTIKTSGIGSNVFAYIIAGNGYVHADGNSSLILGQLYSSSSTYQSYIKSGGKGSIWHGYHNVYAGSFTSSSNGHGSLAGGMALDGKIQSTGHGSIAHGMAGDPTLGTLGGNIISVGHGSLTLGYAIYSSDIKTNGKGSVAIGYAAGIGSQIYAKEDGNIVFGRTKYGNIDNLGKGGLVCGYVDSQAGYTGASLSARSYSMGSFVFGYVIGHATNVTAIYSDTHASLIGGKAYGGTIKGTGMCNLAFGYVKSGKSIGSTGLCSAAIGSATSHNITSSGYGSWAIGYADTADIIASANNAFQLGPGTNNLATSLKVANGIRICGGSPGAYVRNGDLWVDSGYIYIRTNSKTIKLKDVASGYLTAVLI